MKRITPTFLTPILWGLTTLLSLAQVGQIATLDEVRRQQQTQTLQNSGTETVPEIYPGESKETGVQFILRAQPRKQWVEASVDSQYYFTSNALFSETDRKQTGILVNGVTVAFAPTPFDLWGGQVAPRIGYSYQWFNYGLDKTENELNNFDFDSATVFSNVRWTYHEYAVTGGLDWNRLLSHEGPDPDYSQFYAELTPHWSFERNFSINDNTSFLLRYDGYIRITDVNEQGGTVLRRSNDRDEHSITAALNYHILDHLDSQGYYQMLLSDYTADPEPYREDFLNTWGVTLSYSFTDWAALRLTASYSKRLTNSDIYTDYEVYNAGLGANMTFQF